VCDDIVLLRSASLVARIDPWHGSELLELIDVRTGRQLLGHPGFSPIAPVAGELDEETWLRSWRGGWQMLAPNAGNACVVSGSTHGFQGRASNDPWTCVERSTARAVFEWSGHGLRLRRQVRLANASVVIDVHAIATAKQACWICAESIALGVELLDPEVEVELPGGVAYELSEELGPPTPPDNVTGWPVARLLDGSVERCDRYDVSTPHNRFLTVTRMPAGLLIARNLARKVGLEITWSCDVLPHLWVWHEERVSGGPYRFATEMLVFEPASVPHSLGLGTALAHNQAMRLSRGEACTYRIAARVLHDF
jgi:hypothetical protein